MNTILSDEYIEFYRENGFLVMENFLNDRELTSWRDVVSQAVEDTEYSTHYGMLLYLAS